MRRAMAALLTILCMSAFVLPGLRRADPPASPRSLPGDPAPSDPSSVVERLIEDARRGDLPGYLDAFDGPLRGRIEREAGERGRPGFADDLRASAATRKGFAIFAVEPDGPDAARVAVESVYPDRNERQTFLLRRHDGRWRVAEVETIRSRRPRAKFGAPADYRGPEGAPVPGGGPAEPGDNVGANPAGSP